MSGYHQKNDQFFGNPMQSSVSAHILPPVVTNVAYPTNGGYQVQRWPMHSSAAINPPSVAYPMDAGYQMYRPMHPGAMISGVQSMGAVEIHPMHTSYPLHRLPMQSAATINDTFTSQRISTIR